MSKVEELIKEILDAKRDVNSGPWKDAYKTGFAEASYQAVNHLEEIRTEQEELQKRIKFLEKLTELNDETIEKLQATSKKLTNKLKEQSKSVEIPQSMTEKMDKLLKELDDPEKFDQFIEGYHAFVDKDKPVVLPPFIIETMKNYDSLQDMLTEEYYSDCDSSEEIFDDSVYCWIADNFDLLCLAWTTGNYTVKQEREKIYLKIQPEYLEAVRTGIKQFEIRKNDRDYQVDDVLILQEYTCGSFTDNSLEVKITYITDYAQKDNYVVLGIAPANKK